MYIINIKCLCLFSTECDYYSDSYYRIEQSKRIKTIRIENDTLEIALDIKLDSYCNMSLCNILYIGNNNQSIKFLSISINGDHNCLEITTTNANTINHIYTVPSADKILPVDNQYHTVYIKHTQSEKIFKVDDITLYKATAYHYHSKPTASSPQLLPFFISSPFTNGTNGTISNICIVSSIKYGGCEECIGEIKCGKTFNGSSSTFVHYYFNLQYNASIIFNVYSSSIWGAILELNSLEPFAECNYGKNCFIIGRQSGNQETLYVHMLHSGEYVFLMDPFENDWYWSGEVICTAINATQPTERKYVYTDLNGYDFPYWFAAQYQCESKFGTSLATVTQKDIPQAINIINEEHLLYDYLWIGMYQDVITDYKWRWIDGTLRYVNYVYTIMYSTHFDDKNTVNLMLHQIGPRINRIGFQIRTNIKLGHSYGIPILVIQTLCTIQRLFHYMKQVWCMMIITTPAKTRFSFYVTVWSFCI